MTLGALSWHFVIAPHLAGGDFTNSPAQEVRAIRLEDPDNVRACCQLSSKAEAC